MPFDDSTARSTERSSSDLTRLLPELARVLRHKEEWPEGFEWDFRHLDGCALGLANRLWPRQGSWLFINGAERIFLLPAGPWWQPTALMMAFGLIRPEHVASAIDRYLARNPNPTQPQFSASISSRVMSCARADRTSAT